jgi:alpha-beta hydrolase superfamily lysophospholipase
MTAEFATLSQVKPERFTFTSSDGLSIACIRWSGPHRLRGVIQIAHGLGEHMGRYSDLARLLVSAGFVVYGNDHRGHGLTAASGRRGDFGQGGFDQLVEDMVSLRVIAKKDHPRKPFILLAHSLGSFAAQQFVLDHSHSIDGIVLSGTGALDRLFRSDQGAAVADPMRLLNASFEPARTPFDWLSRDGAEVDAFMADPLCVPSLESASMESFVEAFARLADPKDIRNVRQDLPVYVVAGSDDPVGQRLEGVRVLLERYRSAGLRLLAHDFYAGGRHEMFHETNRREVVTNLLVWLSGIVAGPAA